MAKENRFKLQQWYMLSKLGNTRGTFPGEYLHNNDQLQNERIAACKPFMSTCFGRVTFQLNLILDSSIYHSDINKTSKKLHESASIFFKHKLSPDIGLGFKFRLVNYYCVSHQKFGSQSSMRRLSATIFSTTIVRNRQI